MTKAEPTAGDWVIVGLALLALVAGWPMGLLVAWLGPSLWETAVMRTYAVSAFGIIAPVIMTVSAIWGLLIRHRDWNGARRRFIFSTICLPFIAVGYAFLIGWMELP